MLTAEWVDSDLLAHLEELVSEYGVLTDLLLVLHSEILEVRLELDELLGHVLQLLLLDLLTDFLLLIFKGLRLLDGCDTSSAHIIILLQLPNVI